MGVLLRSDNFKGHFGILQFSQKTNERIVIVVKKICLFVFWENSRIPHVLSKLSDLYLKLFGRYHRFVYDSKFTASLLKEPILVDIIRIQMYFLILDQCV